jgi:hypothetical protein
MKNSMKNLMVITMLLCGITFGQEEATASTEESSTTISGEFSTDITFGDAVTFVSPYSGLTISGDGWELSTNLLDGMVNIEEAKYTWSLTDDVAVTFGSQAEPYGLAWGLHRPSNNSFVSSPRDHSVTDGLGVSVNKYGVGADFFYGGSTEDVLDEEGVVTEEGSQYWALRGSYGLSLFGVDSEIGLSLNSSEAQLIDVSSGGSVLGFPYDVSFEYDLAAEDEAGETEASYWLRGSVTPDFAKGAYLLFGYSSEEVLTYGVGYKCNDNMKVITEFSSGEKDADGNDVENDFSIRASYSF